MDCVIEGCERRVYRMGLCRRHHYRKVTHGDPLAGGPLRNTEHKGVCSVEDCGNDYLAKGLCAKHYRMRREHGDPLYQRQFAKDQPCIVRGCTSLQISKGYCGKHYQRYIIHGDPETSFRGEIGKGTVTAQGYVILHQPSHPNANKHGRIPEHRLVMSEIIGRPLIDDETVHHKNGIRTDNRPENLELWVKNHHPGQRVRDKVAWAREILERYGDLDADTIY